MRSKTSPIDVTQLHLDPGEQVQRIFLARALPGLSHWVLGSLLLLFAPRRMVVITNKAISILRPSATIPGKPELLIRLPNRADSTPVPSISWIRIGTQNLWLYKQLYEHAPTANSIPMPRSSDREAPQGSNARSLLAIGTLIMLGLPLGFLGLWDLHSALTLGYPLHGLAFPVLLVIVAVAMLTVAYRLVHKDIIGSTGHPLLAASIFIMLGLPIGFLGLWDLSSALTLEYRLLGLVFVVVAAAMLAAAYCISYKELRYAWGFTIGASAGVLGVGVGLYLFISQWGYPHRRLVILWGIFTAFSTLSLLLLPRSDPKVSTPDGNTAPRATSPPEINPRRWSAFTKAVASLGISATLIWGAMEFWYSNQYIPSTLGAALVISPTFKDVGPLGGLRVFSVEVVVKNTSSTKVRVLTSLYKVEGARNTELVKSDASFFSQFDTVGRGRTVSRFHDGDTEDIVQFGKLLEDNWYFEPGEELRTQLLIYVPPHKYDRLRFIADIVVAKGSRLILEEQSHDDSTIKITHDDRHPYDMQLSVREWPLKQVSNIRGITKGRHAVDIIVLLVGRMQNATRNISGYPTLLVCIDQADRNLQAIAKADPKAVCPDKKSYRDELQDFYGMIRTSTEYEVPISETDSKDP